MMWFLAAFGLYLHVYFWGAAAAVLMLPRRLERAWPGFAPFAGLALQSAIVYAANSFPLRGTNAYGWPALILPLGLTAFVLWRRRSARQLARDARAWWPVAVVQAALIVLLLAPLARGKLPLTSASLGSCDAADYAAGARVFQEFAPDDRTGFLGQSEVVHVGSVDDFHTYFIRLNHFTPSALMAINGTILGLHAHEITLLFTALLPVFLVPIVFVGVRVLFRFRAANALVLAGVIAGGSLTTYAVYHVAPAQILATMGVLVLTWAGVRAFEEARGWRGLLRWLGVGAAAIWLLAGSYNFILVVAFVPCAAWMIVRAFAARAPWRAARWLAWAIVAVLLVCAFAPSRFFGLAERFALFAQYPFGWPIHALRPDGWLGAVGDIALAPARGWLLAGGIVLLAGTVFGFAVRRGWRGRPALALLAFAAPAIAGYAFLLWEESRRHDNSSYDAYKLICVFLPLIAGALCPWMRFGRRETTGIRAAATLLAFVLVVVNLAATTGFRLAMRQPPLVVDRELAGLARVESIEAIDAVNMRVESFWARLWANAFLLRKRQYFPTDTYETRWHSPLRADFDLREAFVRLRGPAGEMPVFESRDYTVVDRRAPWFVGAAFDAHWFAPERFGGDTWRWSEARPALVLRNPHAQSMRVRLALDVRAAESREFVLSMRGREVWRGAVGLERARVETPSIELEPGENELVFDSLTPATPAPGSDPRRLLVALFGVTINVQRAPDASP